jgi:UDP-GlcNAc:undecaprenyl-phosphate GlcNAc-1-phosphate transferase
MRALPLIAGLLAAALIVAPTLRALAERGAVRENYRSRRLPCPAGVAIVAAAIVALVPLSALQELSGAGVFEPDAGRVTLYALGVAFLGLVDDAFAGPARGWRGHGAAVLAGGFSTGALKAVGALGLAGFALAGRGLSDGEYLLAIAVLLLATNLLNLLDLRPGRSIKALVLLGTGLTLGTLDLHPAAALGLFLGPALVVGAFDLRERAMLGDTGANLAGGLAGLWLVLALGTTGQVVALALLAAITAYGELRSLSALIERTPLLRQLDSIGRPA